MKKEEYFLSINGWVVLVCLAMIVFCFYYLWFYPILSLNYEKDYWVSTNLAVRISCELDKNTNIDARCQDDENKPDPTVTYNLRAPKYLANFVDRQIELIVTNLSDQPQIREISVNSNLIKGEKDVLPYALDTNIPNEDGISQKKSYFEVKVPPRSFRSYWINVRLPIYPIAYNAQYARVVIMEDGKPLAWDGNVPGESCETTYNEHGSDEPEGIVDNAAYVCIENNPYNALRHSAIENLLLPPWANGLIPLFLFGIVLAIEHMIPFVPRKVQQNEHQEATTDESSAYELSLPRALMIFLIALLTCGVMAIVAIKLILDTENTLDAVFVVSIIPLIFFVWPRYTENHLRTGLYLLAFVITILVITLWVYPWVQQFIQQADAAAKSCDVWGWVIPINCAWGVSYAVLWVSTALLLAALIAAIDHWVIKFLLAISEKSQKKRDEVEKRIGAWLKSAWQAISRTNFIAALSSSQQWIEDKFFPEKSHKKIRDRLDEIKSKIDQASASNDLSILDELGKELDQIRKRLNIKTPEQG